VSRAKGLWVPESQRPETTVKEDAVTITLGFLTLLALMWDGIRHNNLVGIDSFWSIAHISMYTGLTALGVWIASRLIKYQGNRKVIDFSIVPRGYGLAVIALPLAAIAGPADFTWHSVYGFENQIDSAYSPPHQGLFIAGALLAAIPAAAAWKRIDGGKATLRTLLPAIFSVISIVAVMLFVIHQLSPFYAGVSVTGDFQNDLKHFNDAYLGGNHSHHTEGLRQALTHYGDNKFPYYFYSTHHTVAGILLTTAALMGALMLMRRRWRLPLGTVTLLFTTIVLLYEMLSEYHQAYLIPSMVLGGIAGDLLLDRFVGDPPPGELWRYRFAFSITPPILWALYFLCVALMGPGGLGWSGTLCFGVLVTSGTMTMMLSLLVFQPHIREENAPQPGSEQVAADLTAA
jgi:hypothetical protein